MAASLFIEEESGTYTARFRQHPHNGYYAGDFSQTSRSEVRVSYAERRDVPRAPAVTAFAAAIPGHLTGVNNPGSRPRSTAVTHPPEKETR